jgi:hypothetical protein
MYEIIEEFFGTKPTFQPSQMKAKMKNLMKNGDDILKPKQLFFDIDENYRS